MSWKLEGVHVGFLRQMMGQKAKQQRDGTWRSEAAGKLLKEANSPYTSLENLLSDIFPLHSLYPIDLSMIFLGCEHINSYPI